MLMYSLFACHRLAINVSLFALSHLFSFLRSYFYIFLFVQIHILFTVYCDSVFPLLHSFPVSKTVFFVSFLAVFLLLSCGFSLPYSLQSAVLIQSFIDEECRLLFRFSLFNASVLLPYLYSFVFHPMRSRFQFNPNQPLGRLSIIWSCFRSFLFIFRFLVCILPVLSFWTSLLCLQE